MTDSDERYYRSSGAVPVTGTLILLLGGLVAILPVAFVYALLQYYIPVEKLKVLITVFYAAAVGGFVKQFSQVGAIRSRGFSALVGFVLGVAAAYSAWLWYLFKMSDWNLQALTLDPVTLLDTLKDLANRGIWVRKGKPLSSTELFAFWGLEAASVIITATVMAAQKKPPYCEACRRWTQPNGGMRLPLTEAFRLRVDLEEERYDELPKLAGQQHSEEGAILANVNSCPACDESHFLTLSEVKVVRTKKETKTETKAFVTDLIIPGEIATWVRQGGVDQLGLAAVSPEVAAEHVEDPIS
jgi:hypothetical protein